MKVTSKFYVFVTFEGTKVQQKKLKFKLYFEVSKMIKH